MRPTNRSFRLDFTVTITYYKQ